MKGIGNTQARLRTGQIIVLAMLLGMLIFAVLAWALGPTGSDDQTTKILLWASLGYTIAMIPLYFVMAPLMTRSTADSSRAGTPELDPAERSAAALVTLAIIRGALAEGAGLFGAVVLLLTGNALCLIPIVVATLLLVLALPTESKLFGMGAA